MQFWYEYFVEEEEEEGRKWYRCYGLEDWTFAQDGRMRKRYVFMRISRVVLGG